MTAEDLYEEMKEILKFFGLRFNQKNLLKVEVKEGTIIFSHGGKAVALKA